MARNILKNKSHNNKGINRGRSDLLQGTLDMLILKTLASGPMHGYAIARRIKQVSNDFLQVEEGSLYPALHRMQRRRLLSASWGMSDSNRRAKYYRLTPNGRKWLKAETVAWNRLAGAVNKVMSARLGASLISRSA